MIIDPAKAYNADATEANFLGELPLATNDYADTRRTAKMVEVLTGTFTVKAGHAQMLKGGVIMDVVNAEQEKIAAQAGAVRVGGYSCTTVVLLARCPVEAGAGGNR